MALKDLWVQTSYKFEPSFKQGGVIWSVTSMYLYGLKKYDSGKTKKIIVEINNEGESSFDYMLDVILIKKRFDFHSYYQSSKYDKRKMILDVLHKGIMDIAEHEGWEITPLTNSYKYCIDKNLEHKWLRKDKYFLSPNRNYYAAILCNWDSEIFEAFAIFLDKGRNEIRRVKLFESEPFDVEPMGKMAWSKDSNEFTLYSKDGKNSWTAKIN